MNAHALVVALVVELDADADERLARPPLEAGLRRDELLVPDVGAVQDVHGAQRPGLDLLEALLDGLLHEQVVSRRRVVVAVAGVLSPHDSRQRPYVDLHHRTYLRVEPRAGSGTDAGPAERRRGDRRGHGPPRLRQHTQRPFALR